MGMVIVKLIRSRYIDIRLRRDVVAAPLRPSSNRCSYVRLPCDVKSSQPHYDRFNKI